MRGFGGILSSKGNRLEAKLAGFSFDVFVSMYGRFMCAQREDFENEVVVNSSNSTTEWHYSHHPQDLSETPTVQL